MDFIFHQIITNSKIFYYLHITDAIKSNEWRPIQFFLKTFHEEQFEPKFITTLLNKAP